MAMLKETYPDKLVLLHLVTEPKYPFSFKERMELLVRILESSLPMCADEFVAAVISVGKNGAENDLALTNFLTENGCPTQHEIPRPGLLVGVLDSIQSYMLHRVNMTGHDDPVSQLIRRFYAGLPKAFSFSDEEQLAWEQHLLGDWFPTDDPLTIAFACLCLPKHVCSLPIKLELIRTCCDDTVQDFDTFLQGAKHVAQGIASLADWIYRTQGTRPVSGDCTIRSLPINKKVMAMAAFLMPSITSDDPELSSLAHETAMLFQSKFVKGQVSTYWPSDIAPITTTEEDQMPIIMHDYNESRQSIDPKARELLLLWLEGEFHHTARLLIETVSSRADSGLVAELGNVEKMRQYLVNGTGVCLWNGGNGPVPMLRYAHSRIEDAIVHIFSSELPKYKSNIDDETIRLLVEVLRRILTGTSEGVINNIVERAIIGPLKPVLDIGMHIGFGVKQQRMLGEGRARPLGEIFGSPGPNAIGPAAKPLNDVPDLKKVLGTYQAVTYSDVMYSVLLKMFSESPRAAIQALLELDVLAKELSLSEEQYPKALMYIFSKRPQSQSVNIPKTPEGCLQEQVEFVLYWTLLTSHLNGYPISLKPLELEVVFKYIHSEHYRATLIYII